MSDADRFGRRKGYEDDEADKPPARGSRTAPPRSGIPPLVVAGVLAGLLCLGYSGGGVAIWFLVATPEIRGPLSTSASSPAITITNATRTRSPMGGTTEVRVTYQVHTTVEPNANYVLVCRVGNTVSQFRTTIPVRPGLSGTMTLSTPDLMTQPGAVTVNVEKVKGNSTSGTGTSASNTYRIP